jgi:mannose-6-phosphate isomerase-like protein (cupin superfamily)
MQLQNTFAVIKPDLSVETIDVSPTLYQDLDARFDQFRSHQLVATYEFTEDWPTWERHPQGDEIVILLSGAATMLLQRESGQQFVEMAAPGEYVVVPRNTWHTARVRTATRMLFITPGEGTENRTEAELRGS